MSSSSHTSFSSHTLALLALAALGTACTDNVTCVFTTGCVGGGPPISDHPAALPIDGEWIKDGPPVIEAAFPSGTQRSKNTPVVLVFNETMQAGSLEGAFDIVPLAGAGAPGQPVGGVTQALVSDGRVLVLLPGPNGLDPGDYVVQLADQATALDLTGLALAGQAGTQFASFNVGTRPTDPQLVMTFPADDATFQSETTEIVAVFDREVLPQTVDGDSFDVKVDGADPLFDPPATSLRVGSNTDARVFLYHSLDAAGLPAPLGRDAVVELRLSPAGDQIAGAGQNGGILAAKTIQFHTLAFAPPLGASLLSDPRDAIGLANLTDGDPEELAVEVELDAAEPNDVVELFLFGTQKTVAQNPPLVALQQRTKRLSGTAPIQSVVFTREDVGLLITNNDPTNAHFNDGPVTFAFRSRRVSVLSPVRLLDLDADPDVIQDPVLDTTRPTLKDLVGSGQTNAFRSDQRGLSLAGTANEDVRSVEVTTPLGTNGALAPVVGTTPIGTQGERLFLAAPVALGVVAGGTTTYTVVTHDRAQNAGTAVDGTFTQLGAVGPGSFTPGDSIEVEVFDSHTLEALDGARVLVHSDDGNGVDFPFFASGTTLADGRATVTTKGAPSVAAIVTVVRNGYDLFTLHGVPSTHLSVPLRESALAPAGAAGGATTSDSGAVAFLPGLDQRFDDSRRPVEEPGGFAGFGCSPSQGTLTCTHPTVDIRPGELGARSFFAGDFTQNESVFQTSQLLRAFALLVPLAPADDGQDQPAEIEVGPMLDDPSTPAEDRAQPVPAFLFQVDVGSGVDLGVSPNLAVPFVSVEALVPGMPGAITVAQGLTYDRGEDAQQNHLWSVRAALPGAITAGGSIGSDGRVDTDPFVRVEVVDGAGNAAGARPRLSDIPSGVIPGAFRALQVPTQLAPADGAASGGQAFTLRLTHAIGDERSEPGLYRVELLDADGRGWTLVRFDPAGTADVEVRVVDPADAGALGLADGPVSSEVSAYAWSPLSVTDFLWSDVEREFELFSRAAPVSFDKP